jgi:hypothetical protein
MGLPVNLDSLDNKDVDFRSRGQASPAATGRDEYRMNDAKSGAAGRRAPTNIT